MGHCTETYEQKPFHVANTRESAAQKCRVITLKVQLEQNINGVIKKKKKTAGVPIVAQWLMNPTRNHEIVGSIPGLAQ